MLQTTTLLARSQTNMLPFETKKDSTNFDISLLKVILLSLLLVSDCLISIIGALLKWTLEVGNIQRKYVFLQSLMVYFNIKVIFFYKIIETQKERNFMVPYPNHIPTFHSHFWFIQLISNNTLEEVVNHHISSPFRKWKL